jgi:hypothetical protein
MWPISQSTLALLGTFSLQFRSLGRVTPAPPALSWNRHHMYIDPTTGSLVLQFLAAGVLSFLAMFSRVREAIKSFFKMLIPRRRR